MNTSRYLQLNIFLIYLGLLLSCKEFKTPATTENADTTYGESIYVGMLKTEALKILEHDFTNVHTQSTMLMKNTDGTMTKSLDAKELTWVHKSLKFSIEVNWENGKLSDIGFGTTDEDKKAPAYRNYYAVKSIKSRLDGKKIEFEQ
jgi:hypothetical protein